MSLSRAITILFLLFLTRAELAVDVAVSMSSLWFLKWVNFVPVILHDGNNTVLADQMRSKFFIWANYFDALFNKEASLKYLFKINDDPEYKTLKVDIKNQYPSDLTYTPNIDIQSRCLYNDNLKVVNEEVNRRLHDFHVTLRITCDPKPSEPKSSKANEQKKEGKDLEFAEKKNEIEKIEI